MSFFNSKEEVINIELTSYGKFLLSKGLLKPVYYSFHDEDILYDSNYAGFSEPASVAEVRIQEQTPYLKPLYSFKSPKPSLERALDQENYLESLQNLSDYNVDYFDNSIGNSTISNLYLPAWNIKSLSINFNSIQKTFGDNLRIPQFNCALTSSIYITTQNKFEKDAELQAAIDIENTIFINNDVFLTEYEELVLKIEEENVDADIDKFDIEVYKVETDSDNVESYVLMKFVKEIKYVDNNNLLRTITNSSVNYNLDKNYIEKYLEFNFDKNINTDVACKYIIKSITDQDQIFETIDICNNVSTRYQTNNLYDIITDNATGKNC
jgi:hypothetical protein